MRPYPLPDDWHHPPIEFSLAPFWFWNDDLDEHELSRQLDEFQAHGVDAFVLHPRLGLPEHLGWMTDGLIAKMRFIIEQAQARGMLAILYDEGMYPSGSSAGGVVAENPDFQCRGMVRINLDTAQPESTVQGVHINADREVDLSDDQTLIAQVTHRGHRYAIVERPIDSVIRGLHYVDETVIDANGESRESSPPATDLLNPDAVACFIRLVYDRFYTEFGDYFGTVIPAIFTDEPALLGRPREKNILPATRDILHHINDFLGYDFTHHLPALWDDDVPDAIFYDFEKAIEHRFETTYYAQLYNWCESHNIALTGHPAEPDATRHLRYFHMPGQDIVWRYIEPDQPSALEGRQSTQGKAASSMMLHSGRRRNINEFCGAYGHDFTFEEMVWLANWLLIRGCNWLIPHAFYYSIRGPRRHERPPMLGIHSPWWDETFTGFALACRRLSWLNTDSQHVCHVAILGSHHRLPWRAAKACFQHQIDFNYLDIDDLADCTLTNHTLTIADQSYHVLIVDDPVSPVVQSQLERLAKDIKIIYWTDQQDMAELEQSIPSTPFKPADADNLRVRHVRKAGFDWYLLFNEGRTLIHCELDVKTEALQIDLTTDETEAFHGTVQLDDHQVVVIIQPVD